jgi:hypothetical protein
MTVFCVFWFHLLQITAENVWSNIKIFIGDRVVFVTVFDVMY